MYNSLLSPNYSPIVSSLAQYGIGNTNANMSPVVNAPSYLPDTEVAPVVSPLWGDGGLGPGQTDSLWGNAFGENGWAPTAVSALSGIGNAWLGMKQYGLAKKQFSENKRQFNLNYGAQKNLINSQLSDRQARRHYERPDLYQSPGEYMDKWGVK